MFKTTYVDLGGPTPNLSLVINGVETKEEYVAFPAFIKTGRYDERVKRIGFLEVKKKDTRSDYERWQDEYYHAYYPTPTIIEIEVKVPTCVKKIFIPNTIEAISKQAFKNLKDVTFEIDEKNYRYAMKDGKIVDKHSGEVIWPYEE